MYVWREEGERALDLAMQKLRLRDPDEARNWFEKVKAHVYACMYAFMYVCVFRHPDEARNWFEKVSTCLWMYVCV